MIRVVFVQVSLPKDMKYVPVHFVDTPGTYDAQGVWRRPNTDDSVKYWLISHPQPGHILAVSNQPHVIYQDAVLKTLLPFSFTVESVGPAARSSYHLARMHIMGRT